MVFAQTSTNKPEMAVPAIDLYVGAKPKILWKGNVGYI